VDLPPQVSHEEGSFAVFKGTVDEVYFHLTRKMLYRDDNVIGDLLPEIDLVYTFQCPVTVAPSTNGQDDKSVDAAVLQAKKTENGQVVYTVMYGVMGGILLTDKELKQAEFSIDIAHPTKTFRIMASENLRCLHLKIMVTRFLLEQMVKVISLLCLKLLLNK
jgi:hypothetical protein